MTNFTRMGEVIQKIARDHGENSLRNPQFLTAVFMDYAPMMKKEKELLRAFLLCNGAEKLLGVKNSPQQDQKYCFDSIVQSMADQYNVAESSAHLVCAEFYWAVMNCEWSFAVQKAADVRKIDLDVHRDISISQKERNTGKKVAVSVGQRAVYVSIPANVADGETLCFLQKGMTNVSTGAAGDLYITIHITAAPVQKPWGIIAAVATAVLLLCFFLKGNNSQPDDGSQSIQNNNPEQVVTNQNQVHVHSWQDASCTNPKTCGSCGQTSGTALGHQWREATYQMPQTCSVCKLEQGEPLILPWKREPLETPTGITYVSPGGWSTYALTEWGKVYAIGRNQDGQMNVSGWSDIVDISGGDRHIAVLHENGTVDAIGRRQHGQCNVDSWSNIVDISAGVYCTVGICEDGNVKLAGQSTKVYFDVSDWTEIIQVDVSDYFIVGLRVDGTVVYTGGNGHEGEDDYHEKDYMYDRNGNKEEIEAWENIAAVAVGKYHTLGLRFDGTVVATTPEEGEYAAACDVSDWKDIVAISAGDSFSVGLRRDGTVVVAGDFNYEDGISEWKGSIRTVESWSNIVQISAVYNQIIGLTKDGYIVACGFNTHGNCDTEKLHSQIIG